MRRLMVKALVSALAALALGSAHAGLFDDDEASRGNVAAGVFQHPSHPSATHRHLRAGRNAGRRNSRCSGGQPLSVARLVRGEGSAHPRSASRRCFGARHQSHGRSRFFTVHRFLFRPGESESDFGSGRREELRDRGQQGSEAAAGRSTWHRGEEPARRRDYGGRQIVLDSFVEHLLEKRRRRQRVTVASKTNAPSRRTQMSSGTAPAFSDAMASTANR